MATLKLNILPTLWLALLLLQQVGAEEGIGEEDLVAGDATSLATQLDQLKLEISVLESAIEERTREVKGKDDIILRMDNNIQEKSNNFAALLNQVEALKKRGAVAAKKQVGKAHERAGTLEKEVEDLKREIENQNKGRDALEARASEAEKKVQDLSAEVESLQKINNEQKNEIHKIEHALQVAEKEVMEAKLQAASKANKVSEVHEAWLPPWLSTHMTHYQLFMERHWKEHGKPVVDAAVRKALEKYGQTQKWAEPRLERVRKEWIPALEDKWLSFRNAVHPHIQFMVFKAWEVYATSKSMCVPYAVRVQEVAAPYIQEAKKLSKPYVITVVNHLQPHIHNARNNLKPYTTKVVLFSNKIVKSAIFYHHQVQVTILETMKKHEYTKHLATEELVWFMSSALLALPMFSLLKFFAAIFSRKKSKHVRSANSSHARKKHKRRNGDK